MSMPSLSELAGLAMLPYTTQRQREQDELTKRKTLADIVAGENDAKYKNRMATIAEGNLAQEEKLRPLELQIKENQLNVEKQKLKREEFKDTQEAANHINTYIGLSAMAAAKGPKEKLVETFIQSADSYTDTLPESYRNQYMDQIYKIAARPELIPQQIARMDPKSGAWAAQVAEAGSSGDFSALSSSDEGKERFGFTQLVTRKGDQTRISQLSDRGGRKIVELEPGEEYVEGLQYEDFGPYKIPVGKKTGVSGQPVEKGLPPEISQKPVIEASVEEAKTRTEKKIEAPSVLNTLDNAIEQIDRMASHPGRKAATGFTSVGGEYLTLPGGQAANYQELFKSLKSNEFRQNIEIMRGYGSLSNAEGSRLDNMISALSLRQGEEEHRRDLYRVRDQFEKLKSAVQKEAQYEPSSINTSDQNSKTYRVRVDTGKGVIQDTVTEADIQKTMQDNGLSRKQVMMMLGIE